MKNINPHYLALPHAHSVQTGLPLLFSEVFFMEEKEIWKSVEGFPCYSISNFGRLKSFIKNKNAIIKQRLNSTGYLQVALYENKLRKRFYIHQLVAAAFLGHKIGGHKLVVNHKDFNRLNNHISNLEIVTSRENGNQKHIKSTSDYVGVYWHKCKNKWAASIYIVNKCQHLGYFNDELKAALAYENAVKNLNKNIVYGRKAKRLLIQPT